MYVVNGQMTTRGAFEETAKQLKEGLGSIVMGQPGFLGYYIVKTGERTGHGVLVFDTADEWAAAQDEVVTWFKANIQSQLEGEGIVSAGECIVALEPHAASAEAAAPSSPEARPH